MPSHQERREPLPKGYQFGDGGHRQESHHDAVARSFDTNKAGPMPCEHRGNLLFDFTRRSYICRCGAFIPEF